jgi:autotransporter-associated beta strand protein
MFAMRSHLVVALFLACTIGAMLANSSASAATYYWDSNSTTPGFGAANGTWGTSTFWSTDSAGTSATANTAILATDDINFGTASAGYTGGRTVAISGTQTANSMTIGSASGAITLSGGTAFNLGNANTIITQNSASNTTISSVVGGGANGLTKAGSGRLILTAVNTYSGNTVVNDGILRFGSSYNTSWVNGRLPASSNLEINGGVVEAYYYLTRTLGSGAGEIQITGGRSGFTNLQGDATANFVTFGTTGTTVTWGSAAFAPSTFVMNDVGASAVMRIPNPFDLNGAARTIEVSATGVGAGRGTYGILTGNLSGTGASLVKTGAGTLMLDGTNSYDGGTTINAGGVWFRDTAAMPASGNVTVNDGGILSVGVGTGLWTTGTSGVGTIGGLLAGDGGQTAAQVTYSGNVGVGFNVSGTQTYSGDIADVTGSTSTAIHIGNKDGSAASDPFIFAGTLTLNGNNSYTGATSVNVGTLIAGSANALGNGGDITFNGGTLQYTAASAGNDYGSRIVNSTAAIALNTNSQNVTLSGIAAGNTGGLTKTGAGKLTFTGTNAFTGLTTLSGGSIEVSNGTVSGGGLSFGANNLTFSILGGSSSATWNAGNQNFETVNSARDNIQMVIDGDGVEGSAVLTNVNLLVWGFTHTNSTITLTDGGQINVTGEVRIGNPYYSTAGGANMNIGGGTATSTFSGDGGDDFYIGYGERENSNNNVVTVSSGGVLTNIRDMVVGHVNNQQGNGNPSTANQLTVTGTGTASMRSLSIGYAQNAGIVSDPEEANANLVEVTSGGQLSTSGTATNYIGRANAAFTESNANTLTITGTGSSWNAGNQTIYVGHTNNAGATSNNNILTVSAGGVLTNVNSLIVGFGTGTETGNQVVLNGGTIWANSITVNAGNTLSGSGTLNVSTGVTVDGVLSPGNSIGTMSVGGNLTWNGDAGTPWVFELGPGNTADLLTITGGNSFTKGTGIAGTDFVFDFSGSTDAGTFDLVTWAGGSTTFAETDFDYTNLGGGNTGSFQISGTTLQFVVVPEPATLALVACGGAIGFALLRRPRGENRA